MSRLAGLSCRYSSPRLPALLAFNTRRLHSNPDNNQNHNQKHKQLSLKVRFPLFNCLVAPVL